MKVFLVGCLLQAVCVGAITVQTTHGENLQAPQRPVQQHAKVIGDEQRVKVTEDIAGLFRVADANKDGVLSVEEFAQLGLWSRPMTAGPAQDALADVHSFLSLLQVAEDTGTQASEIPSDTEANAAEREIIQEHYPKKKRNSIFAFLETQSKVETQAQAGLETPTVNPELAGSVNNGKVNIYGEPLPTLPPTGPCLLHGNFDAKNAPFSSRASSMLSRAKTAAGLARFVPGCYQVCPKTWNLSGVNEAFGGPFGPDPYYGYGTNSLT